MTPIRTSLLCFTLLFSVAVGQPSATRLWKSEAALQVPESVRFDGEGKRLFVANTGGRNPWAKDGDGSISILSLEGKITHPRWAGGLDGPKGMAIVGDLLVVADIDALVLLRLADGSVAKRIGIPDSKMLNDVARGRDRSVFVSDSARGVIQRVDLDSGAVSVAVEGLGQVNGVLYSDGTLWFLDKGSLCKLGDDGAKVVVARGLKGGLDGLERVGATSFLVSGWQGFLDLVGTDGSVHRLLETRAEGRNAADIGYDPVEKIVYIPTFFANSVEAWRVSE